MKNTLMMLLIATMGMFTTNSNAEIKARDCLDIEVLDDFRFNLHNRCNRKINVSYCYENVAVNEPIRCGRSNSYFNHLTVVPVYDSVQPVRPYLDNARSNTRLITATCWFPNAAINFRKNVNRHSCSK